MITYPVTATFGDMTVALGDGGNPEVFTAPCGFDTKSLNLTAATSEANIPPCDTPDLPGWTARGVSAFSGEVQGGGVMAVEDSAMWAAWFLSGLPKNVEITITTHEIYRGPALLTTLGNTAALASNGKLIQRSVTIQSAGPWTNIGV